MEKLNYKIDLIANYQNTVKWKLRNFLNSMIRGVKRCF